MNTNKGVIRFGPQWNAGEPGMFALRQSPRGEIALAWPMSTDSLTFALCHAASLRNGLTYLLEDVPHPIVVTVTPTLREAVLRQCECGLIDFCNDHYLKPINNEYVATVAHQIRTRIANHLPVGQILPL